MRRAPSWVLVATSILSFGVGVLLQHAFPIGLTLDALSATPTPPPPRTLRPLPAELRGRLLLFALAGQSNMAGYARPPEPAPDPDDRVYVLRGDGRWWLAEDPLNDRYYRAGPGLPFAAALLRMDPTLRVGLIPCAEGATTIASWQRNLSPNTPYGRCVAKIRAARGDGRLGGVLFLQGETDAKLGDEAPLWAAQFGRMVSDLRADVDAPQLPFVFAQVAQTGEAFEDVVRAQQSSVSLPNVTMIRTDDAPRSADIHLTREGNEIVGRRFAEAFWHFVRP